MTQQNTDLPPLSIDKLHVGDDLGQMEHEFTVEEVVKQLATLGAPTHHIANSTKPVRVYPAMTSLAGLRLIGQRFKTGSIIWGDQEETFYGALWTGKRYRTTGRITDVGVRRGRDFVECQTETVDSDGRKLATRKSTLFLTVTRDTTTQSH